MIFLNYNYIFADDAIDIPEPLKIVDFSYSFTELEMQDENFEVVDNEAKPRLVYDKEMGQALQLGKEVTRDRTYANGGSVVISDNSDYSTIKLTNPYKGITTLKECEPYETVETKLYEQVVFKTYPQPYWKKGITISYWIKTSESVNSNVLGFDSDRFQIQAYDLGTHLTTYRFDLEYNKFTDEEKKTLGYNESGVDPSSDFYFEYAKDLTYNGKPLYVDESEMGLSYWLNKNYEPGYILKNDGTYIESFSRQSYEQYKEAPYLGSTVDDHDPKNSNLRYGWTHSEMRLDAASSFYYVSDVYVVEDENDNQCNKDGFNIQLNPNHEETYNKRIGFDTYNEFHTYSWDSSDYRSYSEENAAPSPLSIPDKWHYVTVIIQNDWVRFYLDGKEVDVLNEYSAFGSGFDIMANPWKRFNKGTGSRYGFGQGKYRGLRWNSNYGGYTSPTIMDWIVLDCTEMSIGGGSDAAVYNFMQTGGRLRTDEVLIKNMVFYDEILSDEQIKVLAADPDYYSNKYPYLGDTNADNKVTTRDALSVLMHAAKISELENTEYADVNFDGVINTDDALSILKYTAKLISSF